MSAAASAAPARLPRIAAWWAPNRSAAGLWRLELAREAGGSADAIGLACSAAEFAEQVARDLAAGEGAPVEAIYRDDRDLAMVAEALDRLAARGVALSLRLRRHGRAPVPPQALALAGEGGRRLDLQRRLDALLRARPRLAWRLDAARPPLLLPEEIAELWLRTREGPAAPVADIAGRSLRVAAALAPDMAGAARVLTRPLLKVLLAEGLPELLAVTDAAGAQPFAPHAGVAAETLFVFPERLLPVSRAFYGRGFDLLSALNALGAPTDVLAFGPPQEAELRRIEAALRAVAPRATAVQLRRAGPRPLGRVLRFAERRLRHLVRETEPAPMRFTEREAFFAAESQVEHIARTVAEGGYRRVIMTGAWSLSAIAELRRRRPDLQVACDTHDVFFVADAQANARLKRFLYSPRRQQAREVAALAGCDLVVAISPSDAESLRSAGLAAPLVVESGTFEHARVDPALGADPAGFGYIGTANAQNRLALETLRRAWWPAIRRAIPEARLRIAGAAGKTPEALALQAEDPGRVELAGFVRDLRDFYASVRTMLSPIAIQGGLNFKSVEALVAGRELVTTELGARCIGRREGVSVADGAAEVEAAVARIAATPDGPERRRAIQADALEVFGEAAGFRTLAAWVAGEQPKPVLELAARGPARAGRGDPVRDMLREIEGPRGSAAPARPGRGPLVYATSLMDAPDERAAAAGKG